MSIGFVVWNPFQVFHMGPIAELLDDSVFLVVNRGGLEKLREDFGGSVGAFIDSPHQIVTPRQLVRLDGKLDAFVCPNPFPGMNSLVASRRVGVQYSMTKESYQYGTWRSQFDINLAYGDYTVDKLLRFGPAVGVGNARFAPWFNGPPSAPRSSDRKTIIYLPTWGEFSSVPRFLKAIEGLQEDYDVIVKLHHKIHLTEPDKAGQLAASGIKASYLPHDDLIPLLRQADLVISDYSGAIFDAIYVRKPVLLLQEDPASLTGAKFTFDSIEYARRDDIGPVVSKPRHLAGAVAAIFDGSSDYRERNEQLRAECFSEDAGAAARGAEVIDTFSRHRRNPRSPFSDSTRPVAAPLEPVGHRVHRMERAMERAAEEGPATSQAPRPPMKDRLRHSAKAAAEAVGAPTLLPRLAAAPGLPGGGVRRGIARTALRLSADTAVAISSLEALRRRGELDLGQQLWLADLHFAAGHGEEAARVVESIDGGEDTDAELLKLLAHIYRTLSGPTARWGAISGLSSPLPTPAATDQTVFASLSVDEVQRRVALNAASIAAVRTEFDLAIAVYELLLQANDDLADVHHRFGDALQGAFRLEEGRQAHGEALRRSPFSANFRQSFTRASAKAEKWDEARHAARDGAAQLPLDISNPFGAGRRQQAAFALLDDAFADPSVATQATFFEAADAAAPVASLRRSDYWLALHWRLIRAGAFSAAYRVKDLVAWSLLEDLTLSTPNDVRNAVRLAQALITVGRSAEARRLLSLRLATATPGEVIGRATLTKALADLDFLAGDPSAIVRWFDAGHERPFPQDAARDLAREIYAGRRIAIVGPGRPPEGQSEDRFDAYDVVVRPNLFLDAATAGATGSRRTDVAYFNSGITRLGLDDLLRTAAEQGVRQAVLRRPRDLTLLGPRIRTGTVRFVDIEPSFHLFASSFGIQRMVYDISLYRPQKIDVFNVDFFAGGIEYVEGYKIDNADVSFRGYSHDFRADFILSKNLRAADVVGFDPVADAILDLDVDAYLALLDDKPGG